MSPNRFRSGLNINQLPTGQEMGTFGRALSRGNIPLPMPMPMEDSEKLQELTLNRPEMSNEEALAHLSQRGELTAPVPLSIPEIRRQQEQAGLMNAQEDLDIRRGLRNQQSDFYDYIPPEGAGPREIQFSMGDVVDGPGTPYQDARVIGDKAYLPPPDIDFIPFERGGRREMNDRGRGAMAQLGMTPPPPQMSPEVQQAIMERGGYADPRQGTLSVRPPAQSPRENNPAQAAELNALNRILSEQAKNDPDNPNLFSDYQTSVSQVMNRYSPPPMSGAAPPAPLPNAGIDMDVSNDQVIESDSRGTLVQRGERYIFLTRDGREIDVTDQRDVIRTQ